jgi:hypothetical protein
MSAAKPAAKRSLEAEESDAKRTKPDPEPLAASAMTEPLEAGIEVEPVSTDMKKVRGAWKQPILDRRPLKLKVDILILFDDTGSMVPKGAAGMAQSLAALPSLVQMSIKKTLSDATDAQELDALIRNNTELHFAKYGERCMPFDNIDGFFPMKHDTLVGAVAKVRDQLTYEESWTRFDAAIPYACKTAFARCQERKFEDASNDIDRIVVGVLLTDGQANPTNQRIETIWKEVDDAPDAMRIPIYAIGLGTGTDARFLTSLCDKGFFRHVPNPDEPQDAFKSIFGTLLDARGPLGAMVSMKHYRNDVELKEDEMPFYSFERGVVDPKTADARMFELELPKNVQDGDVLLFTAKFLTADEEYTALLTVGGETPPTGMVAGLLNEAEEIKNVMDAREEMVSKQTDVSTILDTLQRTETQSYAVRRAIERCVEVTQASLCSAVDTVDYLGPPSLDDPPEGASGRPYDLHAQTSSFSQLY